MNRPAATRGLHHIALWVSDLGACEKFYVDLMGMSVEWRPDENNVYLTSGSDNLALHQSNNQQWPEAQRLDHIGFIVAKAEEVDQWYDFLLNKGIKMVNKPKTHRDGARSFYCYDPGLNQVQIIYHPPLV